MKTITLVILLCLVGCSVTNVLHVKTQEELRQYYHLPARATNVIILEDNWITFDLEHKKFLLHQRSLNQNVSVYSFTELSND